MGVGFPEDLLDGSPAAWTCSTASPPRGTGGTAPPSPTTAASTSATRAHRVADEPLDADCDCETCTTFSRGYLRHLFVAEELLGLRLLSLHNVRFLIRLAARARDAILDGTFDGWSRDVARPLPGQGSRRDADPDFVMAAPTASRRLRWPSPVQIAPFIAIFYFLLIRPQRAAAEEARGAAGGVKKGDEIVTAGGIVGEVVHIKDDRVTIKSGGEGGGRARPHRRVGDSVAPEPSG